MLEPIDKLKFVEHKISRERTAVFKRNALRKSLKNSPNILLKFSKATCPSRSTTYMSAASSDVTRENTLLRDEEADTAPAEGF